MNKKKDVFGNELNVGDFVALQTYGNLSAGKIYGFTEKKAKVVVMPTEFMNHGVYSGYVGIDRVVKLNKITAQNLQDKYGEKIQIIMDQI